MQRAVLAAALPASNTTKGELSDNDRLYAEYRDLHEHFGDGKALHRLRAIRNEARA